MVAGRDMPTAKLPAALRDRAGKVGERDPNTAEYLLQAARRIDRMSAEIGGLQQRLRQTPMELVEDVVDLRTPSRKPRRETEEPRRTFYWSPDLWDMDGPSDDELDETEP